MSFEPAAIIAKECDTLLPVLHIGSADKAAQFRDKLINQNLMVAAGLTWSDLQKPPFGLSKTDDYKSGRALFPLAVVVYLSLKMKAIHDADIL